MGLDWNPSPKPVAGKEAEVAELFRRIQAQPPPANQESLIGRFREISVPAYASLGAPRVGFDEAADQWVRTRLEQAGRGAELDAAHQKMHGVYLLVLLPPCDGFPRYSNYPVAQGQPGYERYTFRGQFLHDAEDVIGKDLLGRAFEHQLAADLADYTRALEAVTRPWALKAGVAHVEQLTQAPEAPDNAPAAIADILFCAIRWCRFWSERGHGLEPWY